MIKIAPSILSADFGVLAEEIARTAPDPFCEPELNTPEDVFGRIRGRHAITASNIAKYDGFHGVVIFEEHDPLAFTADSVQDAIDVSKQWFQKCHEIDDSAIYPLVMWNCLWKSGASIPLTRTATSLNCVGNGTVEATMVKFWLAGMPAPKPARICPGAATRAKLAALTEVIACAGRAE